MDQKTGVGLALLGVACFLGLIEACGSSGAATDQGSSVTSTSASTSAGSTGGSTAGAGGATTTTTTVSTTATSASGSTSSGSSAAATTSTSSGNADGGTTSGQWVMGYYVGYDIDAYPIAQIDWTALTHIIFAPMVVNKDLTLDLSFDDSHGTGQADAKALAQAAHAHGVKALLMLGGANAGGNIATAASAPNRTAFVTALLSAVTSLGYDGIDLDWEDSVNLADFVALAQALRAAKPMIVLTYPAGAINRNIQTVDPLMATLAKSLDAFNVQTYYPSTAFAGSGWSSWFNSPISGAASTTPVAIDDSLQRYADAGIPKSKIGMGMSFYAICYTGGITGPRQPTDGTKQRIVGGDNDYPLSAFFASGSTFDKSPASEQHRDTMAQVPFLSLTSPVNDAKCGASTQYISYDDETSILAKGAFSKANGYGGIILWTIEEGWLPPGASGGRSQNALMHALKTAFIDP